MEAAGDVSMASDCDFALNDGEVTMVADMTIVGDAFAKQLKDSKQDAKQDGSDSGVELNGAERSASPVLDASGAPPVLPPAHLDYDGTSEGGSESSSVLSHAPVRKKISASSASSSASCSTPGRAGHPRSRSVVVSASSSGSAPNTPGSPVPAPRPRERSAAAAGRGSSCSRGRQGSSCAEAPHAAARTTSRSQRSGSSSAAPNLMTASLTGSLTHGSSGSSNVRGRGTTRAPAAPRPTPRGATSAVAMSTSTDDGRWPSTVQRPTTLSRTRASSVAADRDRRYAMANMASMTSSSSKTSVNSTNSASTPSPTESKSEKFSTLPRRRRRRSVESAGGERVSSTQSQSTRKQKVTLYHETGAQTALTYQDLEDLLGGRACHLRPIDAREQSHQGVQVDREREDFATMLLDRRLKAIMDMLGFEHSGTPRSPGGPGGSITSTVHTPPKEVDHSAWMKTLELLEQRAATIKKRDSVQRNEIGRLRYEVEHNERLRKSLQNQQEETEAESQEMQVFLKLENAALAESLQEAEKDAVAQKEVVANLNLELERQREECQHLVRISEQRRQEVLTLQARVAALEQRSKESLLQQGAAVSGASVALSALSSRLDDLAVQLEESSLDKALSALTTEAEAVTTRTKEACRPLSLHLENNFQTLDNVTEPELEEEGGGQRESATTASQNLNSARLVNSESIQNLSAAILFRRLQEEAIKTEANAGDEMPGHLVDQVLDVDSLITRVLRAISDTVHSKKLPLNPTDESSQICNGQAKMDSKALQKIEGQVDSAKSNHIPLLNGSNDGTCSETSNMSVNGRVEIGIASEPVTGAA
ncbi:platelet binding protein GspB isoform X2 [Thrips palmi]|uniref:Platelet binding protein GspB isoform X2 n=1 Tax=Thrips palmi TaxID=161013 RepID=A0A6P8YUH0_THRPL|nr:platelet binding protein GspB isoform X2 [Thrips palmi]